MLVGTLLALVLATVWVPTFRYSTATRFRAEFRQAAKSVYPSLSRPEADRLGRDAESRWPTYVWVWQRRSPAGSLPHVQWPFLVAEQALILLIGGGLLAFLIRRDRRRRAAMATQAALLAEQDSAE